ncbi:MAG: hypothetical protein EB168_03540 [Euryarchaeota archaeon]|nr:hypothetical protein [Euryarchaeota archaeon]
MALVSPGVEVSVIDQSQYVPAPTNSVPYILIATAQDKTSGTSTATASGTTAANANKINLVTSQRELVTLYGNPTFYNTSAGTPINGYELNEYGLLAAYSVLGISNRAYIQRVDVDLGALASSLTRPLGEADNNAWWLDTSESKWGIHEWSSSTDAFTNKVPTVITSTTDLDGGVPKTSIGAIGSYAVVATNANNPIYYKNRSNAWVLVGSDDWHNSWPTITGTVSSATLTSGHSIVIQGTTVTLSGTTLSDLATNINSASIAGVTADVVSNKLEIYADSEVSVDGSSLEGALVLANGTGTILTDAGLTAGTYYYPRLQQSQHYSNPRWKSTDTAPRPTGSVWIKTTAVNNGAEIVVKRYNSTTNVWTTTSAPIYENDRTALKNIDPSGGGENVAADTLYVQYDSTEADNATFKVYYRYATGDTIVTTENDTTTPTFVGSETFTIQASAKNSTELTSAVTVSMSGTTVADFVSDFNSANVANTEASVTSSGEIQIKHTQGGVIILKDTSGTPVADAGISSSLDNVRAGNDSDLILSNYVPLTYTAKTSEPTQDPADGTYWYYSASDQWDIMIQDGGTWKGYQNVSTDSRGFDLTTASPNGPIVSATAPTLQSDDTALVYGDLWIDTSDLEDVKIKRWQAVDSVDQWVTIDKTDQTTENGVLFADARWAGNGTTDPVTDDIPTIKSLLTSNYVDIDRPDPTLYPQGMLLVNTRRSGFNVKEFDSNRFNGVDYPDDVLPTEKDAWVTVSGNRADGSAYQGRKAVRKIVTDKLKSGLDANTEIREEQKQFNLLAAPGYPELISNLVTLNNDRNNTAFVVGDSPMRLADSATDVVNWATDANGAGVDGEDGLTTADPYVGVFYPSGRTTDLSGNTVVVPASHMMLRTMVRSDEISYPWLAPAGGLRGTIDNASALGYVSSATGEFTQTAVRQGLRDTLYENKVNPLTNLPGGGLQNYGNKTVASTPSALDRINVARLIAYLRDRLEALGRGYIFEPNDTLTRNEIKQAAEQLLNDVTAKRGIYDYLVVCDDTNNTSDRIDRNELYVDIAIEPVKSAEFIYIPLRIKNTGDIAAGNL